jgi:hypothetical protein
MDDFDRSLSPLRHTRSTCVFDGSYTVPVDVSDYPQPQWIIGDAKRYLNAHIHYISLGSARSDRCTTSYQQIWTPMILASALKVTLRTLRHCGNSCKNVAWSRRLVAATTYDNPRVMQTTSMSLTHAHCPEQQSLNDAQPYKSANTLETVELG